MHALLKLTRKESAIAPWANFQPARSGGDSGIGRAVAVLFAREGADIAVLYLNELGGARQTQRDVEAEGRRCVLVGGDVRDPTFCDRGS
jgi:NAD(P)-dependent dehydrogenase (short-subunit alcohol dehydrogenase family)